MKRLARPVVFLLLLLAALSCTAAAQENGVLRIEQAPEIVRRGSAFRITLAPVRQAAAFVLFAEYDAADIERAEATVSGGWDGDYTYVSAQEGRVAVVYTAEDGRTMPAGARITFTFKTHSGALSDTLPVRFTVADAASADAQPLLGAPQTLEAAPAFQPAPSSNSALLSLLPPEGALSPAFDPDIFDYTLEVPHACASLVFDAVPADGASVRVNRKNLGAPGSTVDFEFTVTAADGKTKSTYTVAATRLPAEENETPAESTDSRLVSLTPPAGQLVPDFDPEILDYTLDVPFSSVSLTFDAVPADGASVRVNRKNLGAGGSTVDFEFTVTAADGETKTTYTVAVTRLKKDAAGSAGGTGSTGGGRGTTGKNAENSGAADASEPSAAPNAAVSKAEPGTASAASAASGMPADGTAGTAPAQSAVYDRLLTVGLTLFSVGFGAALTFLLLRFLPAAKVRKRVSRTGDTDENRPES